MQNWKRAEVGHNYDGRTIGNFRDFWERRKPVRKVSLRSRSLLAYEHVRASV